MSGQHGSLLGGGAAPTTAWISAFSTLPHTPSFPTSTGHLPLPSAFSTAGGAARGTIGGRQLDFPSLHAADGLAPVRHSTATATTATRAACAVMLLPVCAINSLQLS
ncbi:Os08g0364300 [Oryza sativa Japonica Group]|nr:Os08g0364300 [Oryza sativa Japonica Group]